MEYSALQSLEVQLRGLQAVVGGKGEARAVPYVLVEEAAHLQVEGAAVGGETAGIVEAHAGTAGGVVGEAGGDGTHPFAAAGADPLVGEAHDAGEVALLGSTKKS